MSAKHAVLGMLAEQPGYPYQLRDRIEHRLGPAWAVSSGHMTQTIATLLKEGFIEPVDRGTDAPDRRKPYSITGQGKSELDRFAREDLGVKLSRSSIQVQLTFSGKERLQEITERIDAYERECSAELQETMRRYGEVRIEGGRVRADHLLLRLNLSRDLGCLEAELNWCGHAREVVSLLMTRDALWPSSSDSASDEQTPAQAARDALFARLAQSQRDPTDPPGGDDSAAS
jgi:DNA-binding PadR family transcriptional regulator